MSIENLTTAQLTEQIQNFEKQKALTEALLLTENEKRDALLRERDTLTNTTVTTKESEDESEKVSHPALRTLQDELESIKEKLSVTLPKEEAALLYKKKIHLERQLQNLNTALDTSLNEVEKIGKIFENGFDYLGVGKRDFDTEIGILLFKKAQKDGKNIDFGKVKTIKDSAEVKNLDGVIVQIDRGGKNGIDIEINTLGNVIITIDHHELGGRIEPTSGAEGVFLLLKQLGYNWNYIVKDQDSKNSATVTTDTLEKVVQLVNKEDNLTYSYTLEEFKTIYPASITGMLHLISPSEVTRLIALYPDYLAPLPDEAKEQKVLLKNLKQDTIGEIIKRQRDDYEETGKGAVTWSVEYFEDKEQESMKKWGTETGEFGKTLYMSSGELSNSSKIAYAKGYDTLAILDPDQKRLGIFSHSPNLAIAYERIHQKISGAIFPRGTMIIVPPGQLVMTRKKEVEQLVDGTMSKVTVEEELSIEEIEEVVADILGLHSVTATEPLYSAGDVGVRTGEDVSFDMPKGKDTKYSNNPPFRPGDAEQAKPDKGDGRMIPSAKPATFSRELPKQTIDPTLVFELPKVEKSAKDIGDEIDNLFKEINERHK